MLYMCFCGTKLLPDKDIEIKGGDRVAEYDTKKMVLVAVIFIVGGIFPLSKALVNAISPVLSSLPRIPLSF